MNADKRSAIVVGGGGHARSVIDAMQALGTWEIAGIVDPDPGAAYRGLAVICGDEGLPALRDAGVRVAVLGIGYLGGGGGARAKVLTLLRELSFALPAVVDPTAALATDASVGEGAFVGKLAVINATASVGPACIVNTGAVVEHDCVVGELAHVSVNATLCGGVTIGREAFVGAGATVMQGVTIGDRSIVGAGSVVLRDVPAGETVVGVYDGR